MYCANRQRTDVSDVKEINVYEVVNVRIRLIGSLGYKR